MELFDKKSIIKFFNLFYDKKGYISNGQFESEKEIFVRRTVNKWFSGKHLIYYNPDGYKEYLYIQKIVYRGHYGKVQLHLLNYGNPSNINCVRNLGQDLYYGEWCTNEEKHLVLLEMFKLPKQQFKFIRVYMKDYYKLNADYVFSEALKQIGEEITIESTTYDKAFNIAKDLAKQDTEFSQIYEL